MTPETRRDKPLYIVGFGLAAFLTLIPFLALSFGIIHGRPLVWTIIICGVAQVMVHFRYFLHIDFTRAHRDDLQLLLFTALIIFLMVGGTIWIISDQMRLMSGSETPPPTAFQSKAGAS